MSQFIIHKPSKSILFPASNKEILTKIKNSKETIIKEKSIIVVKHGEEEVKELKKLGFDVPAPILYHYEFHKFKGIYDVWDHQKDTAAFCTLNDKNFVLNDMGTAKTASCLYAIDYLIKTKQIKKVLVLAPLSCLEPVWGSTIFESFHDLSYAVVHGTIEKRQEELNKDVDIYIANHDFVKIAIDKVEKDGVTKYQFNKKWEKIKEFDLILVDEASVFRNSQNYLWHALKTLIQDNQRLWMLTGTPTPNAPTDCWALGKLVSPNLIPKYFGQFRSMTMMKEGYGPFPKWEPRPDAHEIVNKVLQPSIRIKKEDCISLPPITFQNRSCELTAEQKRHLSTLRREMILEFEGGLVTASNAADKVIKMRQILCGAVKVDEDDYTAIDAAPRINTTLELIEEAGHKVIVVVPYKGIIRLLEKEIGKHYSCAIVNGDVSVTERNRIFHEFQSFKDPHVLIVHPRVASYGLTLTEANYMIFYAPIDSNDHYEQACQRINRPGQKNSMSIVHIDAHPMERNIYEGLQERKSFQGMALDLFTNIVESKK